MKLVATDYARFAVVVKTAARDKSIRKALARGLRVSAKPVGQMVARKGADPMPHRGGLRDYLQGAKVGVRSRLTGSNPSVAIVLGSRRGVGASLREINRGSLRHPTWGHRDRWFGHEHTGAGWVGQRVPAGTYTRALDSEAPTVRRALVASVQSTLNDIARKV